MMQYLAISRDAMSHDTMQCIAMQRITIRSLTIQRYNICDAKSQDIKSFNSTPRDALQRNIDATTYKLITAID